MERERTVLRWSTLVPSSAGKGKRERLEISLVKKEPRLLTPVFLDSREQGFRKKTKYRHAGRWT